MMDEIADFVEQSSDAELLGETKGNPVTIYVDADACPVTRIVETLARKHGISVVLL